MLSLVSAAWIVPASWPTYTVFFAFAFVFSFVWLDSDAPTSVPHMATATAFVYIAGFPILFFELLARAVAYPVMFAAARRGWFALPRPLRGDASRALDLAAMLGVATIGSVVRVAVVRLAGDAGIASPIVLVALGEPTAYAVMGALSAVLPLPTREYVVAAPQRLPAEDERVDVIFTAVFIVPLVVLLIMNGYVDYGLVGAAAWSLTSLGPHALVQLLIRRRHLLDDRRVALERANRELAHANAELARKGREIEDFAQTVAHDVRVPVSSIDMTTSRVLDQYGRELPDPVRHELRTVVGLARQAQTMARDLQRMVRIVSEPEAVGMVDLGVVTEEALAALEPHIAARGVRVEVVMPLPVVPGRATKLRHVVGNLVANAIRFVPAGAGTIVVSATREDGAVVLSVRDNGIGIPAEYHEAIFEMFRRVPNGNGEEAGSGMGLAIVKRIVEGHGGNVAVQSKPGKGTTFLVWLPASSANRAIASEVPSISGGTLVAPRPGEHLR